MANTSCPAPWEVKTATAEIKKRLKGQEQIGDMMLENLVGSLYHIQADIYEDIDSLTKSVRSLLSVQFNTKEEYEAAKALYDSLLERFNKQAQEANHEVSRVLRLDEEAVKNLSTEELTLLGHYRIKERDGRLENYVLLREPVLNEKAARSPQEKTLDLLDAIANARPINRGNIRDDRGNVTGTSLEITEGNERKTITSQSVSLRVHGNTPYTGPIIAGPFGDVVDTFGRMFFEEESPLDELLKEKERTGHFNDAEVETIIENVFSNNLTKLGFINLLNDFIKLKEVLTNKYGEGFKIFSKDILLYGKEFGKDNKYVHGSPDLILIDKSGVAHIIDMKTRKIGDSFDKYTDLPTGSYSRQINYYRAILSSYGIPVANDSMILWCDLGYDSGISELTEGKPQNRITTVRNPQGVKGIKIDGMTLSEYAEAHEQVSREDVVAGRVDSDAQYIIEPRLHVQTDSATESLEEALNPFSDTEEDFEQLLFERKVQEIRDEDPEEAALFEELFGDKPVFRDYGEAVEQEDTLHSMPELIQATEIQYVADSIMHTVSNLVTRILKGEDVSEYLDLNTLFKEGKDIRKLTRAQILNKYLDELWEAVAAYHLGDYWTLEELQEAWEEGEYRSEREYQEDVILNRKKAFLIAHKSELKYQGYTKLLALEDTLVLKSAARVRDRSKDSGDNRTLEELLDALSETNPNDAEAWMLGERHFSPKASLSQEVRRMLENIRIRDKDGMYAEDKYGYGFSNYLDPAQTVSTLLSWLNKCNNWQEMRAILEQRQNSEPWVKNLLEELDQDASGNLRIKFFRNFKKAETKYGTIISKFRDGKRVTEVHIINTKSSYDVILNSLRASFNRGSVGVVVSDGEVNEEGCKAVLREIKDLERTLYAIYDNAGKEVDNKKDPKYLEVVYREIAKRDEDGQNIISRLTKVINSVGVLCTEDVVNAAVAGKLKGKNNNRVRFLLNNARNVIQNSLRWYVDERNVNPIKAGAHHSAWVTYTNILGVIADAVQEHVEASVYNNGKTYYSYCNPSALSTLVDNLKDSLNDEDIFNDFIDDKFRKFTGWFITESGVWLNDWIRRLVESPEMRMEFDHKVQLGYNGTAYRDMGSLTYQLSILHEFYGAEKVGKGRVRNQRWAWYAIPTMSNKPSSEFIKFVVYDDKGDILKQVLLPTFTQETNRIIDVLEHWVDEREGKTDVDKFDLTDKAVEKALVKVKGISGSEAKREVAELKKRVSEGRMTREDLKLLTSIKSGSKFHFLYYLNNELNSNNELGEAFLEKLNTVLSGKENTNEANLNNLAYQAIGKNMNQIVEDELDRMEAIGLFDTQKVKNSEGKVVEVLRYQDEFGGNLGTYEQRRGETSEEALERAKNDMRESLKHFILNDIAANINIIQLTGTDLAYFGDAVNYQKRIAMIHSSGTRLYNDSMDEDGLSDGYFRSIHISDHFAVSEVTNNAMIALEKYRDTLTGKDKEDMNIFLKVAEKAFKEINTTDGQSFSSPTSMRKKLRAMGKWEDNFEEAYQRIRQGNFNINDLGVLMQPLKPFVAAQLTKYSGSSTMQYRKVPLQDKNSEYVILLAEALSRQLGQKSRMSDIFDFMEKSAYSEDGTYLRDGIDTVHFDSVGKVGVSGVIDLSDKALKESGKTAYEILVEKTKNVSDRPGRYNDAYVDTIAIEEYIEQQEVPAHLTEHDQLYGSQIRILGISDISEGVEFNVKGETVSRDDLVTEYKNLHAANIRDSYEMLKKELGLDDPSISEEDRMRKLEAVLQEELLKDGRYGPDLRIACTLTRINGKLDFRVPLFDPIQSVRIQNLISSIIKKRINKQTINGGPVVQTTVYDRHLSIVFKDKKTGNRLPTFNEWCEHHNIPNTEEARKSASIAYKNEIKDRQGGIMYYECYMPIPNETLKRLMTNPDGSMMSFEELNKLLKDNPEAMKAITEVIGYRIPTEDKYSMMPLKIVGFVPEAAGQVIVMPEEITLLTNADFDIDKMYIMLKDIEIGNNDTINNIIRNIKVHSNTGSRNKELARKARNNRLIDLQWSVLTNEDTTSKLMYYGDFAPQKRLDKIIRILKAGIINEETHRSYTKAELDKLYEEKGIEALEDLLIAEDPHNTTLPSSKIYFQGQNMQGTQMVGIFANHNVAHAFLTFQKLGIDLTGYDGTPKSFYLNGVEIGNPDNMIILDQQRSFGGKYISKTIAEFLESSVDIAKEPSLSGLNVNTFTGNIAMTLARLGFDTEFIGFFLAQPVLVELSNLYFKEKAFDEYFSGKKALNMLSSRLQKEMDEGSREDYYPLDNVLKLDADTLTSENLIENISRADYREDEDALDFQYRVLIAFKQLYDMSYSIGEVTYETKYNSVTNAGGPDIASTILQALRHKNWIEKVENGQTCFYNPEGDEASEYDSPSEVINNDPILSAFFDCTLGEQGAHRTIFKEYFPHYYEGFERILDVIVTNYTKTGKIDNKTFNKILNDYIYYMLTCNYEGSDIRAAIPYNKEELDYFIKDLVERFRYLRDTKGNANPLLNSTLGENCLFLREADDFITIDTLTFYGGRLDAESAEKVKNAWSDLITSPDPELRTFGVDLFYYTLMKNGFTFHPNTMMHLASIIVKERARAKDKDGVPYSSYIEGLGNIRRVDSRLAEIEDYESDDLDFGKKSFGVEVDRFINQLIRNNSHDLSLVPHINKDNSNLSYEGDDTAIFEFEDTDEMHFHPCMKDRNKPYEYVVIPRETLTKDGVKVISFLYRREGHENVTIDDSETTIVYKKISKLGIRGVNIEYNFNEDIQQSYYEDKRNEWESEEVTDEDLNTTNGSPDTNYRDEAPAEDSRRTLSNSVNHLIRDVVADKKEWRDSPLRKTLIDALMDKDKEQDELITIANNTIEQVIQDEAKRESIKKKVEDKIKELC